MSDQQDRGLGHLIPDYLVGWIIDKAQGSVAHHTYIQDKYLTLYRSLADLVVRTKVRLFWQFELLSARTYVLIPLTHPLNFPEITLELA